MRWWQWWRRRARPEPPGSSWAGAVTYWSPTPGCGVWSSSARPTEPASGPMASSGRRRALRWPRWPARRPGRGWPGWNGQRVYRAPWAERWWAMPVPSAATWHRSCRVSRCWNRTVQSPNARPGGWSLPTGRAGSSEGRRGAVRSSWRRRSGYPPAIRRRWRPGWRRFWPGDAPGTRRERRWAPRSRTPLEGTRAG